MKSAIDLHTHTNESDGEFTPEQLVDTALNAGVKILAITDHETVSAVERAIIHAKGKSIEIIPGIEISCDEKEKGYTEVHVLGLFIDHKNKKLKAFCDSVHNERITQKKEMIRKLQTLGFDITFDEVARLVGYSFGRPHIARVLMQKYPEKFPTTQSVFDHYIGTGKAAYVERSDRVWIKDAISLIQGAGGIPVLAHPGVFRKDDAAQLIDYFVACGGKGIETYYSYDLVNGLTKKDSDRLGVFFRSLAKKHHILESGGSDYHGKKVRPTVSVGSTFVPLSVMQKMKAVCDGR